MMFDEQFCATTNRAQIGTETILGFANSQSSHHIVMLVADYGSDQGLNSALRGTSLGRAHLASAMGQLRLQCWASSRQPLPPEGTHHLL